MIFLFLCFILLKDACTLISHQLASENSHFVLLTWNLARLFRKSWLFFIWGCNFPSHLTLGLHFTISVFVWGECWLKFSLFYIIEFFLFVCFFLNCIIVLSYCKSWYRDNKRKKSYSFNCTEFYQESQQTSRDLEKKVTPERQVLD